MEKSKDANKAPKMGDDTNLLVGMGMLAAASMGLVLTRRKYRVK